MFFSVFLSTTPPQTWVRNSKPNKAVIFNLGAHCSSGSRLKTRTHTTCWSSETLCKNRQMELLSSTWVTCRTTFWTTLYKPCFNLFYKSNPSPGIFQTILLVSPDTPSLSLRTVSPLLAEGSVTCNRKTQCSKLTGTWEGLCLFPGSLQTCFSGFCGQCGTWGKVWEEHSSYGRTFENGSACLFHCWKGYYKSFGLDLVLIKTFSSFGWPHQGILVKKNPTFTLLYLSLSLYNLSIIKVPSLVKKWPRKNQFLHDFFFFL